ncbi:MAG: hypothetical protein JXB13_22580 [Phycisphaerae bacterium]|nr:hypothetical protein [Phycisphaerae bacterium]
MDKSRLEVAATRRADGPAAWDIVCRERGAPDRAAQLAVRAAPVGKSIELKLSAPAGHFARLQPTWLGNPPHVEQLYRLCDTRWLEEQGRYGSCFADVWQSDASGVGVSGAVTYDPLTSGRRQPLRETYYVTFSRHFEETLPNPPREPSPYLDEMAQRVVHYYSDPRPFMAHLPWFESMQFLGADRLLVVGQFWMRYGFDVKFPTHVPARPIQGGDEAFRALTSAVMAMGHRYAPHQNLYDHYPDSPDYNKADRALESNGQPIGGWDWGAVKAHFLKPSKLLDYARRLCPELKTRYHVNASFYDIMPTHRVDYDAGVEGAGIIRVTHEQDARLAAYARELYGGPVLYEAVSEGVGRASMLAGSYDGGMAGGMRLRAQSLSSATELLKVHPKMANHGLTYYERWALWGRGPGWATYSPTAREMDDYRAMTIGFGRVGAIPHQLRPDRHGCMRDYHLMQAFTHAYTGHEVVDLRYEDENGEWMDAGTAGIKGPMDRLKVVYDGDQAVYVNRRNAAWDIDGLRLPPAGCYTRGPRAEGGTCLDGDRIADYAEYGGPFGSRVFADARSHVWTPSTQAVARVRAHDFKDLGGGAFELTLTWTPHRTFTKPHRVGAYFKKLDGGSGRWDMHVLDWPEKKVEDWNVGEKAVTGPLRFQIGPDHTGTNYFLGVTLWGIHGRIDMIGVSRDLIAGYLDVRRDDDDKVLGVFFKPTEENLPPMYRAARYTDGMNFDKPLITFRKVATDGAVLLKETDLGTEIVAYPTGQPTRVGLPGEWAKIELLKPDWTPEREVATETRNGWTWFETSGGQVRYLATRADE